jgi:hypothetical protein
MKLKKNNSKKNIKENTWVYSANLWFALWDHDKKKIKLFKKNLEKGMKLYQLKKGRKKKLG